MCVIERKTYFHDDGRQETIEKTRPCHRAVGKHLCRHVERRSFEVARVVETKPSSSSTTPPRNDRDGYIVTEGSRGQQRLYRDLSKRSSNSSSVRRSTTMSDRTTPVSTPSSASSPSYVEVKPEAPSPPPAAPGFPFTERTRTPYSSSRPLPSFTKDGTAIYDRPPSLDQPRAFDNERPSSRQLEKESSFSSTTAEVDDADEPTMPSRRHRPSVSFDSTARPATSSSTASGSVSSPGISQLKSALRRDSGRDVDRKSSPRKHRSDSDRQRRKADEDDRQARLERDRLAESDRRQSAREQLARNASRERRDRHRREAAEALEGVRTHTPTSDRDRDDPIQRGRDAERAEMERERERAAQLRRGDEYHDDQLRRDAEARAQYNIQQPLPSRAQLAPRPSSSSSSKPNTSPRNPITSARAFNTTTAMQPRIHQAVAPAPAPVRRESRSEGQTIAERGADVIARERARAAGRELNDVLGDERVGEAEAYQARVERGARDERFRYGDGRGRYR